MKNQFEAFENALANLQYVLIARRVQASDEPMRLNWKHFDILVLLKEKGGIRPSVVSESLHMSRSSVSKYLKYLEEKNLVSKIIQEPDGRSHQVALTSEAKEILANIYKGQYINAVTASKVLTPVEMKQFTALATKIANVLDSDELHVV